MPVCKKCGNEFPSDFYKDGVKLNLRSRKYCLQCSPYGKHNTRALPGEINGRHCEACGTSLTGNSWKYCDNCRSVGDNAVNKNSILTFLRRGNNRKDMLIEMLGGKCQICGYKECSAALVFHHIGAKRFSLTKANLANRTWEAVVAEAKKCQLLCANCHMEIHYPDHAMGDEM